MRMMMLACAVAALATPALAAPAAAGAGLRTLSWPGKPVAAPAPGAAASTPPGGLRPMLRGRQGLRPLPTGTLRPAVFTPPPGLPPLAPAQPAAPAAPPRAPEAPVEAPEPAAAVIAPGAKIEAAPLPRVAAAPAPAPVPAPPAANPVARVIGAAAPPVSESPRRYSLHREFGQTPDRPALPAPVYLDNLPVDLAEPPPPPLRKEDERRARSEAFDPDRPASSDPSSL
jgi:hypothetical protein